MSCLHTISKSPQSNLLETCLSVLAEGDAILFIEDGVYHCSAPQIISAIDNATKLYGLREDLLARATLPQIDDAVEAIDTARFVELCAEYDKVLSWF